MTDTETTIDTAVVSDSLPQPTRYHKPQLQRFDRWQVITGSILDCALDPFNPACEVIE